MTQAIDCGKMNTMAMDYSKMSSLLAVRGQHTKDTRWQSEQSHSLSQVILLLFFFHS